jgi:hypothetical protein
MLSVTFCYCYADCYYAQWRTFLLLCQLCYPNYAECPYDECCYTECHYAECHYASVVMLNVIMLIVMPLAHKNPDNHKQVVVLWVTDDLLSNYLLC